VSLRNSELSATFDGSLAKSQTLILNVALLGFDQKSNIRAGENQGKELEHNFVVLEYNTFALQPTISDFRIETVPFPIENRHSQRLALASWVSQIADQTPIQATGGWLK
jgi:hypothetical protein